MSVESPTTAQNAEFDQVLKSIMLDKLRRDLPWYDASWLHRFLAAQQLVKQHQPERLADFLQAFEPLQTPADFAVRNVPDVFTETTLQDIRDTIAALPQSAYEGHEVGSFGRSVVHDHPFFTELQQSFVPLVSELAGEEVEPSYNFLSLYSRFGVCEPHIDAPWAKWTLDICLDQSVEWPIHFSQIVPWPDSSHKSSESWKEQIKSAPDLSFSSHVLQPNQAILFSGSSQWHYRDALPAQEETGFCNLLFFHFIPKGTRDLIDPRNWAQLFDMPQLQGPPFDTKA